MKQNKLQNNYFDTFYKLKRVIKKLYNKIYIFSNLTKRILYIYIYMKWLKKRGKEIEWEKIVPLVGMDGITINKFVQLGGFSYKNYIIP